MRQWSEDRGVGIGLVEQNEENCACLNGYTRRSIDDSLTVTSWFTGYGEGRVSVALHVMSRKKKFCHGVFRKWRSVLEPIFHNRPHYHTL